MTDDIEVWPGRPSPFGATYDGAGTNFCVFSEAADRMCLSLFEDDGRETQVDLEEVDAHCWHAYLPSIVPGQHYGYRADGPWDLDSGLLSNPAKLLLDPYAKAIDGQVIWDNACFSYNFGDDHARNDDDSAPFVPKSVVHNPYFDWSTDRRPSRPMHETVIYEAHVKGLTALHPDLPPALRGTYAGVGHPAVTSYLTSLGVTAIELQPVHQFVHDNTLLERNLRNYWGYNTIGFFAPHNEYASGGRGEQVQEFKTMVRSLHEAGIEVILDVVYNHTAEGNHLGPVLSFKGLDNHAYYRLVAGSLGHYYDTTGTGNSLNVRHPRSLQVIMDSLRYWVEDMHVDGFRFDLAAALARQFNEVDRLSAFFDLIQQDPIVSQVKLIAEPWDLGEDGYHVGNFPSGWSEWNGKYRDTVRDFWRGEPEALPELASRLTGSSDLYGTDSRGPAASINFVTAHDGFTLADLVSYNEKHNDDNGENNCDGENHNRSWNCGTEGPTADGSILALRRRQQRNFLATLLLSQGVPMVLAGDECGRTQHGNNNAYCQDNEISWFDWENADADLQAFTRSILHLRREHPVFRRRRWFEGSQVRGVSDISWFRPDGAEMDDADWGSGFARSIGVFLNGGAVREPDERGQRVVDDSWFLLINAHDQAIEWFLPELAFDAWDVVFDTSEDLVKSSNSHVRRQTSVGDRSMTLLKAVKGERVG